METKWKTLCASVRGTSHRDSGVPCQDSSLAQEIDIDGNLVLVCCVADGAGSASLSHIGSKVATSGFLACVQRDGWRLFDSDDEIDPTELGRSWCREVRAAIEAASAIFDSDARQMACTLLAAVVADDFALYIQIGDGAIVVPDEGQFKAVFWPQSGEYANTTNFITDQDFSKHLCIQHCNARHDSLAMFTDGIERLVLKFADQTVHAPFLRPLFGALADSSSPQQLSKPLQDYLNSDLINERTDDDKTLAISVKSN